MLTRIVPSLADSLPAALPAFINPSNTRGGEASEESLPALPAPFNQLPSGETVTPSLEGNGHSASPAPNTTKGEETSPLHKLPQVHVSTAELPVLGAVVVLVLSALGLTLWFLGRRGLSTFFGSRGLLKAGTASDPYLPPPRVLPPSAHERIQDPKYLRGILEAEGGSTRREQEEDR